MSFADLKRKSQNNFDFLQKELEKSSSGKNVDDRFWKPEVDASGNGYAVIRFLPAPEGETIPWAKLYSHAFQGPGGWYIENSLTTLNEKDPVGEVNRRLWNSGSDEDKETARKQKRKLSYYSNILVVKDPKNPENEGKVFHFSFRFQQDEVHGRPETELLQLQHLLDVTFYNLGLKETHTSINLARLVFFIKFSCCASWRSFSFSGLLINLFTLSSSISFTSQ